MTMTVNMLMTKMMTPMTMIMPMRIKMGMRMVLVCGARSGGGVVGGDRDGDLELLVA